MRVLSMAFVFSLVLARPALLPAADVTSDEAALPDPTEGMALIPAGTFVMGAEDDLADNPPHEVSVGAFYMDLREVTNAEYLEYCRATGALVPEFWGMEAFHSGSDFPEHPVVGVSWREATAYAEWRGKRLPTEAEWEYAARGGLSGEGYPNGATLTPEDANSAASRLGGTVPVGIYPPNGYGLYDMAGNVAEWVADRYGAGYYRVGPRDNPRGPEEGRFRVFRGGGWHSGPNCNRVSYRNALPANWRDFNVGFRCVMDVPPGDD
jgi:formylglycine-generating enzyme required for sulfatase activity